MIATEPLPADVWDAIGWRGHETFNDERHLIIYAMRTDDDRIAIGGRGAPYHFGSRVQRRLRSTSRASSRRSQVARAHLFPQIGDVAHHAHLGRAPRHPARLVQLGRARPRHRAAPGPAATSATASSTTNLAGRTLRDLILGHETRAHGAALGRPPVAAAGSPSRCAGWPSTRRMKAMASADSYEERTGKPSKRATMVKRLIGA